MVVLCVIVHLSTIVRVVRDAAMVMTRAMTPRGGRGRRNILPVTERLALQWVMHLM
jgi:hypothetical protein